MRDVRTPLILWICAAICVHLLFGGGGAVVADIHDDHVFLHRLASDVRDRVIREEQTFDVALLDDKSMAKPPEPEPPPPPPEPPKPKIENKPKPPPPELAKQEKKKAEPKPEKKPTIVVEEKQAAKPIPPPPPQIDHRIAVKQHAKANQEDNPNAHFIADEANHVEQETAAQITSHDKDEENPTPGGNHAGPQDKPGDSDRTKIADSEEHSGEKDRAPGEKGTELTMQNKPMAQTPPAPQPIEGPKTPQLPQAGGDTRTASAAHSPQPQLAPGAQTTSPEVNQAADGTWTFNPVRPNAGPEVAQTEGPGTAQKTPATNVSPTSTTWLGLGGKPGPGQVNLNLSQAGVIAAVGADQLRKEREADGERRRSEHRGSWIASNFERWRSAIENYVSSVKPGNQTALNTAAVPFASYLNSMHNRIHPIFADSFLDSLDGLPASHPLNDQHLITKLEIVLTKDGHLHKMGIVRTSGITAFDIAALDAVQRASPFGPAPSAIVSPDGNVYLHWEFHRDEVYACSTMNARPFLLNVPPKGPEPEEPNTPGSPPSGPHERGVPPSTGETREGMLDVRDVRGLGARAM
jgi:TonB family protein